MPRYYFHTEDSETCHTIEHFKEYMKENDLTEMTVFEAIREVGSDFFYCREYGTIGEKYQGCGKECNAYAPRNKKNGICAHSRNPYEFGDQITITL